MDFNSLPSVGPYMYVSKDRLKRVTLDGEKRTFRIVLYGAYNALGLIGSECNGIVVLDEDRKQVVADEMLCNGSGWGGPDAAQRAYWVMMLRARGPQFRRLVNASRRLRYAI